MLALELGRVDVAAMLEEISAVQLQEWAAYYAAAPFGPARADVGPAITSALIYNAFRGKTAPRLEAADFLPFTEKTERKKVTDPAEIRAIFMGLANGNNSKPGR